MSQPQGQVPPASAQRWRMVTVVAAAALLLASGVVWFTRARQHNVPELVERALKASRADSRAAERLLREVLPEVGQQIHDVRLALAIVLAERQEWDESLGEFQQADLARCTPGRLMRLAALALRDRRFETAQRAAQSVADRNDAYQRDACDLLLRVYQATEQWPQEKEVLRALTRLAPAEAAYWRTLISRVDEVGIQTETIAVMREALAAGLAQPEQDRIRQDLVGTLMLLGDAEQARDELAPLLERGGRAPAVDLLLVKLLRLEGNPRQALTLLEDILPRLGAAAADGLAQKAMLLIDLRKYEEAIPLLEQIVADDPFDQFAHYKLADAYRALGRPNLAEPHARLAAEIKQKRLRIQQLSRQAAVDPRNRQLFEQLAELHRELNENDAAARWEQRALSAPPPN